MRSLALVLLLAGCASGGDAPAAPAPAHPIEPPREAVLTGSFESASAACNEWAVEGGATAIRSVPPRSGDYACKLCATESGVEVALARGTGPVEAGRYVLEAYLRRRPGLEAPDAAQVILDAEGATMRAESALVPLRDDGYVAAKVAIDVPAGTELRARIAAPADAAQCFLVDDVVVERQ